MVSTGHVIFGLPGETTETIHKTIKFVNNLPLDFAQFYAAAPWPGTELYRYAKKTGILKTDNFRDYTQQKGILETGLISPDEITKFCKLAYKKFYFRPKIIYHLIKRMLSVKNIMFTFKTSLSSFIRGKTKN